jgi:hypothetical protein
LRTLPDRTAYIDAWDSMVSKSEGENIQLALLESGTGEFELAPWIGPLVALGGMALKYASSLSGRQLVVAASVPSRDFAAALVGCGWIIASQPPRLDPPMEVLRTIERNVPVRIVTDSAVIEDVFLAVDEGEQPEIALRGSRWLASKVRAVSPLANLDRSVRSPRPGVGSIARWARLESSWDQRLASSRQELAIVGTRTWINADLGAFLVAEPDATRRGAGTTVTTADEIGGLLLVSNEGAATSFTRVYAASRIAEQLPLPADVQAAVLDGTGSIKFLTEVEAPVVFCIIDRSVADQTAAELIVQLRNTRGEPLMLGGDLGWRAPPGVEALAYTVAL